MTFTPGRSDTTPCQVSCAEFIVAEGEIVPESQAAFLALWSRLPRKDLPVILNSPGGHLTGALALGRAFRRLNVTTNVGRAQPTGSIVAGVTQYTRAIATAPCNSACVYAFAGGARRSLVAGSTLGVHQFYMTYGSDTARRPKDRYTSAEFGGMQRTLATLATYLAEMQIEAQLLTLAAEIAPNRIRALTVAEVEALNLARSGVLVPELATAPVTGLHPAISTAPAGDTQQSGSWPVVRREGRPWLVMTAPGQSRRFGAIANEITIGCPMSQTDFVATFREILPHGPIPGAASARIATGPGGDAFVSLPGGSLRGALSHGHAQEAERSGALELEVVSTATAHYPMRVAFAVTGLRQGLERLEQACAQR